MPRTQPVNSPDDSSGSADDDLALKDRLFELFMARFDTMQERRPEMVRQVTNGMDTDFCHGDACRPPVLAGPYMIAMDQILTDAGVSTDGIPGKVKIASITIIYVIVLKKWIKDDSEDLGVTMAELDRRLDQWIRLKKWMV